MLSYIGEYVKGEGPLELIVIGKRGEGEDGGGGKKKKVNSKGRRPRLGREGQEEQQLQGEEEKKKCKTTLHISDPTVADHTCITNT